MGREPVAIAILVCTIVITLGVVLQLVALTLIFLSLRRFRVHVAGACDGIGKEVRPLIQLTQVLLSDIQPAARRSLESCRDVVLVSRDVFSCCKALTHDATATFRNVNRSRVVLVEMAQSLSEATQHRSILPAESMAADAVAVHARAS